MKKERNNSHLKGAWYPLAFSTTIKPDRLYKQTLADLPIVYGRLKKPFALIDNCPHRGLPLSYGSIQSGEIHCKYHGWSFDPIQGQCLGIPCLTETQRSSGIEHKIKATTLECVDHYGILWAYLPWERESPPQRLPFDAPDQFNRNPDIRLERIFKADVDQSVIGLMDPAHLPFVHTSWWWKKTKPGDFRLERKHFEPSSYGFTLTKHVIPDPGKPYKLLGEPVQTEIRFQLPAIRIELIEGSHDAACSLTALAPIDENTTRVMQCLYWSTPWLKPVKPIIKKLSGIFLDQDRVIVEAQQQGLAHNPSLTLIDGADSQAKWYLRIKSEMERCQRERIAFENPLKPAVLEWMC